MYFRSTLFFLIILMLLWFLIFSQFYIVSDYFNNICFWLLNYILLGYIFSSQKLIEANTKNWTKFFINRYIRKADARPHLETDLSLIPNFSASCFCVIPRDFRLLAIYFPILIRSIHLPPFLLIILYFREKTYPSKAEL